MAFRNIRVALTATSGNLRSQLALAAREVDRFGSRVEGANKKAVSSSTMMKGALAAAAIGVGVGLTAAVTAAAGFEQRMRNVNSISGLSEARLKSLSAEVVNMSRRLPQAANVLAEGLYDVASSGFQGAEGIKVLNAAAEAASAGMTNTAVSAKGITAVLNAYGLGAEHSTDVSDTLFQTVNLGVVTFEELASQIGDVVGAAAAAKVPIDDVGAAIAAMTLAGISGAESTTSLNRVIQSIIDPSDQMKVALQALGYESGAQALEVDGLRGVMERLRTATGGNITSLLQLFPEIRAARGALALMAAEGENYRKTSAAISDEDARQGATRKALNEQMKAVSAQFAIFKNQANAAAITVGSRVLPTVLDLLRGVQGLARQGWPVMQQAIRALMPYFRNLHDIGIDVVQVLRTLADAGAPVAKAAAAIAATGLITFLNTVTTVLAALTGFLADNEHVTIAVATAVTALLIPAIIRAAVAFGAMALDKVALGLYAVAGGADRAAMGMRSLGLSGNVGLLALSVLAGVVTAGFSNANRRAEEFVETITRGMDTTSLEGMQATYGALVEQEQQLLRTKSAAGGWGTAFRGAAELLTPMANSVAETQSKLRNLRGEIEGIDALKNNAVRNISAIATSIGIPQKDQESWNRIRPQIEAVAKQLGVDLTLSGEQGVRAQQAVIDQMLVLQSQVGVSSAVLQKAGQLDFDAMGRLAEAIEDVRQKTVEAFGASNDLFGKFDADLFTTSTEALESAKGDLASAQRDLADMQSRSGEKTRQDVSDQIALRKARERVNEAGKKGLEEQAEAAQHLADVEERLAVTGGRSDSDDRALADARQRVAEATKAVADAEAGVTTGGEQVRQFYAERIRESSQFAQDLQSAVEQGLDPSFIQRALQAGPDQAGPILRAIVSDHSGRLAEMVNESESTLRQISSRMATFARLTTLAVTSETDSMAQDLDTAMKIAAADLASGGKSTAEAIAAAIGVPSADVRRIAYEYGIILAEDIKSGLVEGIRSDTGNVLVEVLRQSASAAKEVEAIEVKPAPSTATTATGVNTASAPSVTTRSTAPTRYRALGGIDTLQAHFATAPTVVYGERSTGGEAFIPLGAQHRARSKRIWSETGRILGMEKGGILSMTKVEANSGGSTGDLRAAIADALKSMKPIDARQTNVFHGGERPTRSELDYANSQHAWKLAGAVSR